MKRNIKTTSKRRCGCHERLVREVARESAKDVDAEYERELRDRYARKAA